MRGSSGGYDDEWSAGSMAGGSGGGGGGLDEGLFRDEMVWKLLAMIGRVGIGPFKLVRYRFEESDCKWICDPASPDYAYVFQGVLPLVHTFTKLHCLPQRSFLTSERRTTLAELERRCREVLEVVQLVRQEHEGMEAARDQTLRAGGGDGGGPADTVAGQVLGAEEDILVQVAALISTVLDPVDMSVREYETSYDASMHMYEPVPSELGERPMSLRMSSGLSLGSGGMGNISFMSSRSVR